MQKNWPSGVNQPCRGVLANPHGSEETRPKIRRGQPALFRPYPARREPPTPFQNSRSKTPANLQKPTPPNPQADPRPTLGATALFHPMPVKPQMGVSGQVVDRLVVVHRCAGWGCANRYSGAYHVIVCWSNWVVGVLAP